MPAKTTTLKKNIRKKEKQHINISEVIISSMIEKKGKNIVSIDFSNFPNAVFSQFVICHGTSRVQVESIADAVEENVRKKTGEKPLYREGFENAEWVLLDYIDVVVHIFQEKTREFYQLESLWSDAKISYYNQDNN